jgi:hypothetical protein
VGRASDRGARPSPEERVLRRYCDDEPEVLVIIGMTLMLAYVMGLPTGQ